MGVPSEIVTREKRAAPASQKKHAVTAPRADDSLDGALRERDRRPATRSILTNSPLHRGAARGCGCQATSTTQCLRAAGWAIRRARAARWRRPSLWSRGIARRATATRRSRRSPDPTPARRAAWARAMRRWMARARATRRRRAVATIPASAAAARCPRAIALRGVSGVDGFARALDRRARSEQRRCAADA